ncbi:MAG: hypothetical protein HYV09_05910 [Deltaproteobacteria bacterium]|nr:hypothetical protein [Deltaproteobacteria bacterium]
MFTFPNTVPSLAVTLAFATLSLHALAQDPIAQTPIKDAPQPSQPAPPLTGAERKAKYALPFAMRPAIAPNLLRIDASFGVADGANTSTSVLTTGGKPISSMPDVGFYMRAGLIRLSPEAGTSANAFTNPLFFALYTPEIAPKLRLPIFAGVAAPLGSAGGDSPDVAKRGALAAGIAARQGMDNALFTTNYLTPTAGIGLAWIDRGLTVQGEVQVLQLLRARGQSVESDASRTNFTSGLNVGYQVIKYLTANVEVHYQRWLSTPAVVERNPAARDQATCGGGLRANIALSDSIIARPGISYFRAFDAPMSKLNYQIVQIDVPIAF